MEKSIKEFNKIDAHEHIEFEKNYLPLLKKISEKYSIDFNQEDGVYLTDKKTGIIIDLYEYDL